MATQSDIDTGTVAADVSARPLLADRSVPMLIEPPAPDVDLVAWAESRRDILSQRLLQWGGILFRGFGPLTAASFSRFIRTVSADPLEYHERSSPRSRVEEQIYTSTEHPPSQAIFPHNENAYQTTWPLKIFFLCDVPSADGGETPLVDNRRLRDRIPGPIWDAFAAKGVLYVRNFDGRLGLSWQQVFQTDSRDDVERYCAANRIAVEWRSGDRLRTRAVRPALAHHPLSGELVWFNHAVFFHVSTLDARIARSLRLSFADDELPNNTYYGDGSPIEADTLDALRTAIRGEMAIFSWQRGDVLMLDNMLVGHARQPFRGGRRILVGMSEPIAAAESFVPAGSRP